MAKLLCETGPKGWKFPQLEPFEAEVGREELQVLWAREEIRSGHWRQVFWGHQGTPFSLADLGMLFSGAVPKASP